MIKPDLNAVGTSPSSYERCKIRERGSARKARKVLRNMGGIPSGVHEAFDDSVASFSSTSASEKTTERSSRFGEVLVSAWSRGWVEIDCGGENTDAKCAAKWSAFSRGSMSVDESELRGGMGDRSLRREFEYL